MLKWAETFERVNEFRDGCVPHANGAVRTAAREGLAVRGEGNRFQRAGVSSQDGDLGARGYVP